MTRQFTLILCITGAAALACSKDKPAQSAYDTREETERPADQAPLTPASSDRLDESMAHPSGSATASPDSSTAPDTIPPRDSSSSTGSGDGMLDDRASSSGASSGSSPNSGSSSSDSASNGSNGQRGTSSNGVTAGDQGQGQSDLDITQQIRQAVMKNSALSFTAKNVKIITKDGKVTLRGTVPTYEERLAIEDAARKVAGSPNVTSEIEVKK
jgi:hypothetical protein